MRMVVNPRRCARGCVRVPEEYITIPVLQFHYSLSDETVSTCFNNQNHVLAHDDVG